MGFSIFASAPVFADPEQGDSPELFTRVDRYISSYVINDDGSFTETREYAMTVLKEQAIESAKQSSITYSKSIQSLYSFLGWNSIIKRNKTKTTA